MYYLLTESFKSQEQKLVAMILETVEVEKIYLLGSTLLEQRTESIFVTTAPASKKVGHYYLLVLVDRDAGHSENYIQDKIENTCSSFVPVTVIVVNITKFNGWLSEGHRFACTVVKIAVLLYDGSKMPLAMNGNINDDAEKIADERYYQAAINKVNEFIAGAELYLVRTQYKMSAFMLHQAAEHAMHSIFKKATGLTINTHNIDKLIRYCTMITYKLPGIFPRNNDNNERLFHLLQKAYIDTRYREDFSISNNELTVILKRIQTLQQLMLECVAV